MLWGETLHVLYFCSIMIALIPKETLQWLACRFLPEMELIFSIQQIVDLLNKIIIIWPCLLKVLKIVLVEKWKRTHMSVFFWTTCVCLFQIKMKNINIDMCVLSFRSSNNVGCLCWIDVNVFISETVDVYYDFESPPWTKSKWYCPSVRNDFFCWVNSFNVTFNLGT